MSRNLKVVDLFCGAGGTGTGIARACEAREQGLDLLAINHWGVAVETHSANHPSHEHLCARVDGLDPGRLVRGRLDLLVASPECTHHSIARGGKPMLDQSRASAWEVVRWATDLRPRWILVENVREFRTWGPLDDRGRPLKSKKGETFAAWVQALRSLNYTVEWRLLVAADYGAATTRQRLFVMARLGRHRALPWPEATHGPSSKLSLFGQQPWRSAREIIDWSLIGGSIFARKHPLADATLRRIEEGLRRFGGAAAEPFLVLLRGTGTVRSVDRALPTITAGGTHLGLCEPFVLGQQSCAAPREVGQPLPTVATAGAISLVPPFILPNEGYYRSNAPRGLDDPLHTVTSRGAGGIVEPFLVPFFGERNGQAPRSHSADEPLSTVTGQGAGALVEPFLVRYQGNHEGKQDGDARVHSTQRPVPCLDTSNRYGLCSPFLVKYNSTGQANSVEQPLDTITTRDRYGMVQPVYPDIRFRMLQPHELSAAMGFPKGYRFAGNKGDQVKQIGNAVSVEQAQALAGAILEAA